MITYLLLATLWVSLEQDDGTVIECATSQPIEYHHSAMTIQVDHCGEGVFGDGFEDGE